MDLNWLMLTVSHDGNLKCTCSGKISHSHNFSVHAVQTSTVVSAAAVGGGIKTGDVIFLRQNQFQRKCQLLDETDICRML